jgi:hypothetical protein
LIEEVSKVFLEAQRAAQEKIDKINIYDFEHIVFRSSYLEGIWEPETLLRIFELFHKITARESTRSNTLMHQLTTRIRSVSNIPLEMIETSKHNSWKIQRLELYEESDYLHNFHMPIDLGDIFEKTSSGKKFILLVQPCDLMVRPEGRRKAFEGVVAEIDNQLPTDRNGMPLHDSYYELAYFDKNTGDSHYVDFRRTHTVSLWIFDLCVYQNDGLAKFKLGEICPNEVIPGWKKLYEKLFEDVGKKIGKYQQLQQAQYKSEFLKLVIPKSSNENLFKGQIDMSERSLIYDCRRTGRLCQPRAAAMLTKFANYLARAAFEVDFGRDLT